MNNHYAYNEESPSCLINKKTGRHLGCVGNHGYYQVKTVKFGLKLAHRVIWEIINGEIPEGMVIDHIDRNRKNNKLSNLRLVDSADNSWNTSTHKDNKLKEKNISVHQNGYAIEVMRKGKRIRTTSKTLEEAIRIREEIRGGLYE